MELVEEVKELLLETGKDRFPTIAGVQREQRSILEYNTLQTQQ